MCTTLYWWLRKLLIKVAHTKHQESVLFFFLFYVFFYSFARSLALSLLCISLTFNGSSLFPSHSSWFEHASIFKYTSMYENVLLLLLSVYIRVDMICYTWAAQHTNAHTTHTHTREWTARVETKRNEERKNEKEITFTHIKI